MYILKERIRDMQVIYRAFDKEFTSEKEALEYEKSKIEENCKFKVGEEVFFLDKIDCRLMQSYIVQIKMNEYDKEFYAVVSGYDGVRRMNDLYKKINPLIYDLRQNMYVVTRPELEMEKTELETKLEKISDEAEKILNSRVEIVPTTEPSKKKHKKETKMKTTADTKEESDVPSKYTASFNAEPLTSLF